MSRPPKRIEPASGRQLALQLGDQRGLAGAVGSDDRMGLAAQHVEAEIVRRDDPGEALGERRETSSRMSLIILLRVLAPQDERP